MRRLPWLVWLFLASPGLADKRILDFHSDILVRVDGWIQVTETISVRAEGNRIRRGIHRDLPTEYEDKLGNDHVVDIVSLAVPRNDALENRKVQEISDGIRVHFEAFLPYALALGVGRWWRLFRRPRRWLGSPATTKLSIGGQNVETGLKNP